MAARQNPPPSTVGCSCVYVVRRKDGWFYCGQTDDLRGGATPRWPAVHCCNGRAKILFPASRDPLVAWRCALQHGLVRNGSVMVLPPECMHIILSITDSMKQ